MNWEREIEVARQAAVRAGERALELRESGVSTEWKPDNSPVTNADRECERLIAEALEEAFPDDGLLGEEGVQRASRSGRRWIIDPIDGTRDYVRGAPAWAVLIGLEDSGDIAAGAIYLPVSQEMYFAAKGFGAYCDDQRLAVSTISTAAQAMLCFNGLERVAAAPFAGKLLDWITRFSAVRSLGNCLDPVMVASGTAEAWIEPAAKPWDLAPLKVLIEEAGGRFFNFDGGSTIHGGNCVICAPGIEPEIRSFLGLPNG